MKRIANTTLLLLLLVAAVCFLLPSTARAESVVTGVCGENAQYSFDGAGTLTITGTGVISSDPYDDQHMSREDVTAVVIQSGITGIGESVFANFWNLTGITIPDTVRTIGACGFSNCWELKNIVIPNSVTNIGESAFYRCKGLSDVTLGNGVISIGQYAFSQCTGLTQINIPNSVTSIGIYAFENCSNLSQITIPDSVGIVGGYAFYGCEKLTSVKLGNGITDIGEATFEFCKSLTDVVLPDGIVSIGACAFHYCSKLTDITIPNGVTAIGEGAFSVCAALSKVILPNTITEIGNDAFSACPRLTDINFPNNLEKIGDGAFSGCTNLTDITIPNRVESVGEGAFSQCSSLKTVFFKGDSPQLGSAAFSRGNITAYYPCENNTWTETVMQNYGGTVTWKPVNYQMEAPTAAASSRAADGKPVVKWNAVDGAVKYQVYNSTDKRNWKQILTTTGTGMTNISAEVGEYYYYYVVAVDSRGNRSISSNIVGRTCDLERPVVTIINNVTTGKPKLSWSAVDGAVKYQIYSATNKDGPYARLSTTTKTGITNTSARAGTKYYYKVRAIHSNENANSAYSAVVYRTCDLERPVVTIINNVTTGKPKLSWSAVDGAVKYQIYSATSKDGPYTRLSTTTKTGITNISAQAGTKYYYKVRAVHSNTAANSAYSAIDARTCDLPRPNVTVMLNSNGKPRLAWDAIDEAVSYKVYRATSKTGSYTLLKTVTSTCLTNTSAVAGKTYYYQVKAIHKNAEANSAYSAVDTIKAK